MATTTATLLASAFLLSASAAYAAPILETELNGTQINNTLATAQVIPWSAFTTPVPATVFDPPGYPTATITGRGGIDDVDMYSFTAAGAKAYFDIDNDPFTFDTVLSLFDSTGTLIAYNPFGSFPFPDPGSSRYQDSFLGIYDLPGPGTYYLAVSTYGNVPFAARDSEAFSMLRPDGGFGGYNVVRARIPGDSSFRFAGDQQGLAYTLHMSVEVPEPATMTLLGLGLAGIGVRRWRQRKAS